MADGNVASHNSKILKIFPVSILTFVLHGTLEADVALLLRYIYLTTLVSLFLTSLHSLTSVLCFLFPQAASCVSSSSSLFIQSLPAGPHHIIVLLWDPSSVLLTPVTSVTFKSLHILLVF